MSKSSRWSEHRHQRRVQFHEVDGAGIVHFSRVAANAEKTIRYTCLLARAGDRIATGTMTTACVSRRPDQPMKAVPIPPEIASRFEVAAGGAPGAAAAPGSPGTDH